MDLQKDKLHHLPQHMATAGAAEPFEFTAAQLRKHPIDQASVCSTASRAPSPAKDLFMQDNLAHAHMPQRLILFESRGLGKIFMRRQRQVPRGLGRGLSPSTVTRLKISNFWRPKRQSIRDA